MLKYFGVFRYREQFYMQPQTHCLMLLLLVKASLILFLIYSFKAVRKSLFRLEPLEGMYQCPFQLHSQGY